MFTRFKQNVRTYPRTATAVGLTYLGAIIGSVITGKLMGISTLRQVLTVAAIVVLAFVVDALTYIWFMGDSGRLAFLLETLNEFEGRPGNPDGEGEDCDGGCDLWNDEDGQDVAEYAVMLAVILVIALGTIRLIGSSAGNVFSDIGSKIGGQ